MPPKNFDTERRQQRVDRDRTFIMAGTEFSYRPAVRPEVLARYFDMRAGRIDVDNTDAIAVLDETILAFLDDGQDETWQAARADLANPITFRDMHDLIEWLIEVMTDRPTEASSGSTNGDAPTETTSTVVSSSREPTQTP